MTISSNDDDRISRLPDEILVDILSLLPIDKAARTNVLSSRWINLWKHTRSLNFDESLNKLEPSKYVETVKSVIQSHKSPTLTDFRIHFFLDGSNSNSFTEWLKFAFSRHVQRLEFDFRIYHRSIEYYRFPEEFLDPRSNTLYDFKSLKALTFKSVNVSGGAIEFFLRNCPLLEQLVVNNSRDKISKLEVCGSSLVLKHLELAYCFGLESVKVSASSLTSLTLTLTSLEGVLLENVPMLVDVSVDCNYHGHNSIENLIYVMSRCIFQLETLKLVLPWYPESINENKKLRNFPEMPKLKKLFVEYGTFDDGILIAMAYFTRASPYLQEFVLENKLQNPLFKSKLVGGVVANVRFRHEHIKVFKLCGYRGRPIDDAVLGFVLENFVVLEKIIIDLWGVNCCWNKYRRLKLENAASVAKQHLQPQLPHRVELVIL